MEKMLKKPGRYTIVVDKHSEISSFIRNRIDMYGTYTIVVDNNFKILSVTHNGQPMTNRSALNPTHKDYIDPNDNNYKPEGFEKEPASGEIIVPGKLDHGCIGLGSISESLTQTDPCRWLWGTWW